MSQLNPLFWNRVKKAQKEIDACEHHHGCDSYCTKEEQEECEKLKAHSDAIRYNHEHNIPMWI